MCHLSILAANLLCNVPLRPTTEQRSRSAAWTITDLTQKCMRLLLSRADLTQSYGCVLLDQDVDTLLIAVLQILVDTTVIANPAGNVPYISFQTVPSNEDLVAIGFTYIVPTISALDPQRQVIYFVCVNDIGAFLIAHSTGLDPLGAILSRQDTRILWQQRLSGVLTSLQVPSGSVDPARTLVRALIAKRMREMVIGPCVDRRTRAGPYTG